MVLDLGSDEMPRHLEFAAEEKIAEELRLLYVALTRAQHRCYFVWGAMKGAEASATAWLLHRPTSLNTPSRGLARSGRQRSRYSRISDINPQLRATPFHIADVEAHLSDLHQLEPFDQRVSAGILGVPQQNPASDSAPAATHLNFTGKAGAGPG